VEVEWRDGENCSSEQWRGDASRREENRAGASIRPRPPRAEQNAK